ncbi:MAG TPA: mechanosensitive ion channel family protein [Thermoanaerobaculia bacterium]|nr:mechanosensitive ion channel family protein [Thermoanaerobaculia bacterium]
MIPAHAIPGVVYAAGVVVALELLYVLLRRSRWPVRVRGLYHLWTLAAAAVVGLSVAGLRASGGWRAAASLAAVLGALVLFSLVDSLVFQRPWSPPRGPMMPKLARDVLRVVVLAAAALFVATMILEQPLPAVLVSSTLVSAVIGLALQDVLKNVFAGMSLELEKPFERGDWLLFDGQTVQVIDSSWRSVRLRTRDGVDLWEPNATLSTTRLLNYGAGMRPVGINFHVHVIYEAPPFRVKAALLSAGRSVEGALEQPAPEAFVHAFDESGIDYRLRVWTRGLPDLSRFQDAVHSRIWYELRRQGLAIPYPTRTVLWRHAERDEQRRAANRRQVALELLSQVPFFRELEGDAVTQLAAAVTHQHFGSGEVLVREGAHGDSLFIVEHGKVLVTKASDDGSGAVTLATLGEGGFFGEMSLLTGEPRSATVTAEGGCEVLVLAKEALAPLLQQDPQLAELLSVAVLARQAKTAATLEDRRDRRREVPEARAEGSLLNRIRAFFKLPAG